MRFQLRKEKPQQIFNRTKELKNIMSEKIPKRRNVSDEIHFVGIVGPEKVFCN